MFQVEEANTPTEWVLNAGRENFSRTFIWGVPEQAEF